MARPTKPVAGADITAAFGAELRAYAGEAMEFVRVSGGSTWDLNAVEGTGAFIELELTKLPVNADGKIVYAVVGLMARALSAGGNIALQVRPSATATGLDGISYSTGTVARGGMGGPFMVRLGGANGRSVWWMAGANSNCWITTYGYWRLVG